MTKSVRAFMAWWEKLPVLIGFFFIPIVLIIYAFARIINFFSPGEK
jgi:hypothetical protein